MYIEKSSLSGICWSCCFITQGNVNIKLPTCQILATNCSTVKWFVLILSMVCISTCRISSLKLFYISTCVPLRFHKYSPTVFYDIVRINFRKNLKFLFLFWKTSIFLTVAKPWQAIILESNPHLIHSAANRKETDVAMW